MNDYSSYINTVRCSNNGMDTSCPTNYVYVSCCLIILFNLIYLLFIFIKLFLQNQRRKRLLAPLQRRKMTENINELTTTTTNTAAISSRMATRSTTAAAAAAAAAVTSTATRTTNVKSGHERLAQLYPHITDDMHLPTKWNGKEKASTLLLQQNDLVVTYRGKRLNIDEQYFESFIF